MAVFFFSFSDAAFVLEWSPMVSGQNVMRWRKCETSLLMGTQSAGVVN